MPGFVPYVTIGSSTSASIVIWRSYVAPASVGSVRQRATAASQAAPFGACCAPVQVLEGGVIRGDQPGARPALDAHVADGHPLIHGQAADRLAGVLEDVPRPATDADP